MPTDGIWKRAVEEVLPRLLKRLGCEEHTSRQYLTPVDRRTRQGWRITVERTADGMKATEFVADK